MALALSEPKRKETVLRGAKVGLAVSAVIVCVGTLACLWYDVEPWSPPGGDARTLASAHRTYQGTEFPKRGDNFYGLAFALDRRSKAIPILRGDLVRYLGNPNFTQGGPENGILIFTYRPSKATEDWEASAFLRDGKLALMGYSPVSANDHADYRPYTVEGAPRKGKGVAH